MEYKYKTELHCHTCVVSHCATVKPEEQLKSYHDKGYTTILVTDHFNTGSIANAAKIYSRNEGKYTPRGYDLSILERCENQTMTWEDKVNHFLAGYQYLKETAPKDMNILLGAEFLLPHLMSEYLVFGLTEEFLFSHPNLDTLNIYDLAKYVHEADMLIFAAHPFRNWVCVSDPDIMDGVEVFNGASNHNSRNDFAELWADRYSLLKSSGTDYHYSYHMPNGGILTEEPITSTQQLVEVLKNQQYSLIREAFKE